MASHGIELIHFRNPEGHTSLYIPRIHWDGQSDLEDHKVKSQMTFQEKQSVLAEFLKEKLTPFGLIHSIFVNETQFPPEEVIKTCPWFAYVTYFSKTAAMKARLALSENLTISGRPCKILSKLTKTSYDWPLTGSNCEKLANHYLGFNGWNSQIIYHRLESESELGETGKTEIKYCSAIRLTFKCSDYHVAEGAGMSVMEYDPKVNGDKAKAIAMAHKHSRTAALQNAFAKVILIVVNDSKVSVEIDSTKLDPFYYDPIWEKYEVNVEEVEYDPEEHVEEESIFDS